MSEPDFQKFPQYPKEPPPLLPMCRCTIVYTPKPPTETEELGSKLAAKILLTDTHSGILIPSSQEWYGVGLLERDDDLPNRK